MQVRTFAPVALLGLVLAIAPTAVAESLDPGPVRDTAQSTWATAEELYDAVADPIREALAPVGTLACSSTSEGTQPVEDSAGYDLPAVCIDRSKLPPADICHWNRCICLMAFDLIAGLTPP